jgi:hypothetical protein
MGQPSPDGRWWWDGRQWVPLPPVPGPVVQRTSGIAVASFVSALVLPLAPLSSIAGIVLGLVALREIDRSPGIGGKGLAVAGIVIGSVLLVVVIFVVAVIVTFGVECRNGC